MKKLPILLLVLSLAGCASPNRTVTDASAVVIGAGAGYALSGGDLLTTAAGGAIGLIGSELGQSATKKREIVAYNKGYAKGRSDDVKNLYWAKQNLYKEASQSKDKTEPLKYRTYNFPASTNQNGVNLVDHNYTIRVTQ